MVTNVTSLTGNGLRDWLIQRVSAVYLLFYIVVLTCAASKHATDYATWHALWQGMAMRGLTLVALIMLSLHAWIGLWTVTTDYLKCTAMRLGAQLMIGFGLVAQFIWAVYVVWGQ